MNQHRMRRSQVVMLWALSVMALVVIMLVGVGRAAVSSTDRVKTDQTSHIDFSSRTDKDVNVRDFDSIRLIGRWKVTLEQGDDWHVKLDYPRNMGKSLSVSVEDGCLVLDPGEWDVNWTWNWWKYGGKNSGRKVYSARIMMPHLKSLQISGSSNLDLHGFTGDQLAITVSGAGNLEGEGGRYNNLSLTMSGVGNVDLRDMVFTDALVNLSGAGNVKLGMDGGILSGNLSGFGNVDYYGPVKDERVNISGFGGVHQRH